MSKKNAKAEKSAKTEKPAKASKSKPAKAAKDEAPAKGKKATLKTKSAKKVEKKAEPKHVPTPRVDKDGNLTLNENEATILMHLKKAKDGASLSDMAKLFAKKAAKGGTEKYDDKPRRWAANSVRKPLRAGLLKMVGRGVYALTKAGRAAL